MTQTRGEKMVLDERTRQIVTLSADRRQSAELLKAARSYVLAACGRHRLGAASSRPAPGAWPWAQSAWQPGTKIEMMTKAAALIIAAIDVELDESEREPVTTRDDLIGIPTPGTVRLAVSPEMKTEVKAELVPLKNHNDIQPGDIVTLSLATVNAGWLIAPAYVSGRMLMAGGWILKKDHTSDILDLGRAVNVIKVEREVRVQSLPDKLMSQIKNVTLNLARGGKSRVYDLGIRVSDDQFYVFRFRDDEGGEKNRLEVLTVMEHKILSWTPND